ncbi:MAG TPA: hypothetical protein V6D15_11220 [Oculatellaceae cyanobacterium]|jgi:hypothetical protein
MLGLLYQPNIFLRLMGYALACGYAKTVIDGKVELIPMELYADGSVKKVV